MQSIRVSAVACWSSSLRNERHGSGIGLGAAMRKILSFHVGQEIPMGGFRRAVHPQPFSFRFRERIVAERVFFRQTGTIQNSGVFRKPAGTWFLAWLAP